MRGRLRLAVAGLETSRLGPIVAYLDWIGPRGRPARPGGAPSVRQQGARFHPEFLAIAAGETVEMPNEDAIYHNVFSYSAPNDFDLGLYPGGESRRVGFGHPGVVKIYCSIHEAMSATLFVSPSPWFTAVAASGDFELAGVPPGRWRLRTWSERLPETEREIVLAPGQVLEIEIVVGGAGAPTPR